MNKDKKKEMKKEKTSRQSRKQLITGSKTTMKEITKRVMDTQTVNDNMQMRFISLAQKTNLPIDSLS